MSHEVTCNLLLHKPSLLSQVSVDSGITLHCDRMRCTAVSYTSDPFPLDQHIVLAAEFWGDADTTNTGHYKTDQISLHFLASGFTWKDDLSRPTNFPYIYLQCKYMEIYCTL